jgi:hypothetical protein
MPLEAKRQQHAGAAAPLVRTDVYYPYKRCLVTVRSIREAQGPVLCYCFPPYLSADGQRLPAVLLLVLLHPGCRHSSSQDGGCQPNLEGEHGMVSSKPSSSRSALGLDPTDSLSLPSLLLCRPNTGVLASGKACFSSAGLAWAAAGAARQAWQLAMAETAASG